MKWQIQHGTHWTPDRRSGTPTMVFFLLSGPDPAPDLEICALRAAAARESEARLERLYGISCGPGCCTLLLYSRPGCSNYASDQWS